MADKNNKTNSSVSKNISNLVSNLVNIGRTTNYATYKLNKDLYDTDRIIDKLNTIQEKNKESLKRTVDGNNLANSRINSFGLLGNSTLTKDSNGKLVKKQDTVFDVIKGNSSIFNELRQIMMIDNKLYETMQDYEILRRAIPEMSRVIELLINSIIIPEVITSEIFNIKYSFDSITDKELSKKLKDKYELNKKFRIIVENYLVFGTEYITVVPYKAVVEAIKQNKSDRSIKSGIIKESSLITANSSKDMIITESAFLNTLTEEVRERIKSDRETETMKKELTAFNETVTQYLSGIKIYKSNKKLVYDSALVESVMEDKDTFMFESSFEDFFSDNKTIKTKDGQTDKSASEGLIQTESKKYDNISIKGCKIERLDPGRVYPIRIKDTVVAYVYFEERRDDALRYNLQNSLRNNFSFYRMNTQNYTEYSIKMMEDRMIREIGSRIIENLSPKFLEANFDDMDVFYEFLRDNSIHKEQRDIILLHPKDVIEFKRTSGSVMKNAIFFAKLYLLMVINNILIKVRRGSDRTIYYVDNGLTNDIEGSVMQAIQAIQQSEIRFSDLGTISGIIGSVGSVVDLFVPQSQDGAKPINAEVISGQTVDMDDDFLKFLIKSIILSFNMPSVVVDFTNEVEFAKTLSMANLDVATSSALSQAELNTPLTELLRKVMTYELDLTEEECNSIEATLIPSRSMLMQITGDLIDTTKNLAQSMADLHIKDEDTAMKQLFMKEFVRKYFTYDWTEIDQILDDIAQGSIEQRLKSDIPSGEQTDDMAMSTEPTSEAGAGSEEEDLGGQFE